MSWLVCASAGCAHAVKVHVEGPHDALQVNHRQIGHVPPEGVTVAIEPGREPVHFSVDRNGVVQERALPRSEPAWDVVAAGVACASCLAPACALGGACAANPVFPVAVLSAVMSGDPTAQTAPAAVCAAPTWPTLVAMSVCGGVGLTPLGLVFFAETLPAQTVIEEPPMPAMTESVPLSSSAAPASTPTAAPAVTSGPSAPFGSAVEF